VRLLLAPDERPIDETVDKVPAGLLLSHMVLFPL
jgi:hypothetical protein